MGSVTNHIRKVSDDVPQINVLDIKLITYFVFNFTRNILCRNKTQESLTTQLMNTYHYLQLTFQSVSYDIFRNSLVQIIFLFVNIVHLFTYVFSLNTTLA